MRDSMWQSPRSASICPLGLSPSTFLSSLLITRFFPPSLSAFLSLHSLRSQLFFPFSFYLTFLILLTDTVKESSALFVIICLPGRVFGLNCSWLISGWVEALGRQKAHTRTERDINAHFSSTFFVLSVRLLLLRVPRRRRPSGTQQEVLMMWGLCVLCWERSVVR